MFIKGLTFFLVMVGVAFCWAPESHAQATRTWVSGVGDDANPCSRTAPCKTFAGAISKTSSPGVIDCLDPGGFGALTITKTITIDCDSWALGSVLVSGTNGISIPTNGITVYLRGLDFEGIGTGLIGLSITGSATVHVRDCKIAQFNAGGAAGISFAPSAGGGSLVVDHCIIEGNGTGIILNGSSASANMTVRDSVIANNTSHGISVTTTGSHAGATVDRSTIAFNGGNGLLVSGTAAIAIIGNSTVTGNNVGVGTSGTGTIESFKDNQIGGNVTDGTPITAFAGPGGNPLQ